MSRRGKVESKATKFAPVRPSAALMKSFDDTVSEGLKRALASSHGHSLSCRLAQALDYAVLGGGKRLRPRLLLSVFRSCGGNIDEIAELTAASVELIHCASLVHDDLPCFDDAATRRGKPSLHRAFGEEMAVLAGDALIVLAFESLSGPGSAPQRRLRCIAELARATGPVAGLIAGQALEGERRLDLEAYHAAKTSSLFEAAAAMGAILAAAEPGPWRYLGSRIGRAYQLADDILDRTGESSRMGKETGRDVALGRPNAAAALGTGRVRAHLENLLESLEVPDCQDPTAIETALASFREALVGLGVLQSGAMTA